MMPSLTPAPSMLEKFRAYLFLRKWKKSSLGMALASHSQKFFYTESKLRFFSEADKTRLIGEFHKKVFELPSYPNPFLKFREELASTVIGFADLQVLCLTEEEKRESYWRDCRYISGELHRHIRQCSPHQREMKDILWANPSIDDEGLVAAANTRSVIWLYHMNGLNMVRSEFNEQHFRGRDWLRPFVASAMIFSEEHYRSKIGLPSLLPPHDNLLALTHSTFSKFVLEGAVNPLQEWEEYYDIVHSNHV